MRRMSAKFRARAKEAKPVRDRLVARAGCCMICGASQKRPKHHLAALNQLVCHEISNGPLRQKSLDKPFCILVLCAYCNQHEVEDKGKWPQSRQLAVLKDKSPENYDLTSFNFLVNPNAPRRIEQHEVDYWVKQHKINDNSSF